MANIAYEPVKTALSTIKHLSADEETRRMAFVCERAVRDELTLLKEAEERGIEKGIERGEAMLLQRQLARRFGALPDTLLERIAQASKTDIEQWGDRVLEAASLEDVFQD